MIEKFCFYYDKIDKIDKIKSISLSFSYFFPSLNCRGGGGGVENMVQ